MAPEAKPKKSLFQNPFVLGCSGLLVVLCVLGAIVGPRNRTPSAPVAVPTAAAAAADAPTSAPADTAVPAGPTSTPRPTSTPAPTNTPRPTETPLPTFTPVPSQEFSGAGASVETVSISVPSTLAFTHNGRRNFAVTAFPAEGRQELLVNVIGGYEGTRWLAPGEYTVEIQADGQWSMVINAFTRDDAAIGPIEGHGDYVSGLFPIGGRPMPYSFTHDGERNFAVVIICDEGQDLVVNEIGPVDSEAVARMRGAACFWDVQADGNWTIAPK